MTLGQELLNEIASRRSRGRFFTYRQYQTLRTIDSADTLQRFIDKCGIRNITVTRNVAAIADQLEANDARPASVGRVIWWVIGDVFLFSIPRLFDRSRRDIRQ